MPELRPRSADVRGDLASFSDLLLPDELVRALSRAGFSQPSPVQQEAIPLGRFGADLIVQAKSGTGKTVTFGAILADCVRREVQAPQALIIEPTREVALQTQRTLAALCADLPSKVKCHAFVGGLSEELDGARLRRGCQIVVGTPGRLRALMEAGFLRTETLRILVIDEADTLLAGGFVEDMARLFGALPVQKQVLAFSATYTDPLLKQLRDLMHSPQEVLLCPQTVSLQGVKQLFVRVPEDNAGAILRDKEVALLSILRSISFNQALLFSNNRSLMESLAARLTQLGFPSAFTCGSLPQHRRMSIMESARKFRLRILLSTDLNARGLDLPFVNLVVNLDVPLSDATYMHRVGRTGRFGTSGLAVSVVTASELLRLQALVSRTGVKELQALPTDVPAEWYASELASEEQAATFARLRKRQHATPAATDKCIPEASDQPLEPPSSLPAAAQAADWAGWLHRQRAYSFWWWQYAAWRSQGGVASAPWYAAAEHKPWFQPPFV